MTVHSILFLHKQHKHIVITTIGHRNLKHNYTKVGTSFNC